MGKKLNNPLEIVSHTCALMKFWAGLQKEVDKEALIKRCGHHVQD
jgi:hypothetical protein